MTSHSVSHIASVAVPQIQTRHRAPSHDWHRRSAPHPGTNRRPDLVSTKDEAANAPHASEHNVEVGDPTDRTTERALGKRTAKAERRLERAHLRRYLLVLLQVHSGYIDEDHKDLPIRHTHIGIPSD
jgi:hypothetical protein